MTLPRWITVDGNDACATIAYQLSDVIAIYPITPSSGMAEAADAWAAAHRPNVWGTVPTVVEMQSEAGAAGAVHGALQAGGLATTFTASQGLLLMIPNMFKIAGELTPAVFHVTARAVATHALSIFGDHSDVMAVRSTGFALLSSASVQEAQDLAAIAHAATLEARVPFLHFFDGFRTSHELTKIAALDDDTLTRLIAPALVDAHRARALTPDHPVVRGTAQNPDVFFQNREAINRHYLDAPGIVQRAMDRFAQLTGRSHRLFEYYGAADADRVIVIMGSAADTVRATVDALGPGARVGVLTVKLFRPFSVPDFVAALPSTVRAIAVLDRTKEPGAIGEPLYQDVVTALAEARLQVRLKADTTDGRRLHVRLKADTTDGRRLQARLKADTTDGRRLQVRLKADSTDGRRLQVRLKADTTDGRSVRLQPDLLIIGGRYGLGSKEFTPAMAKAVFDELTAPAPKPHFTVGIVDDVTGLSLKVEERFEVEPAGAVRAVFFGLGADGTVGANRNSVKIIGEETDAFAQGYFVYDSKKSGASTISHLRFADRPIAAPYLISQASFVACHQYSFLERYDVLRYAAPGAIFLLNSPHPPDEVWDELPREVQQEIIEKRLRFYVIDAYAVAKAAGLGTRINTIMQTCFFALLERVGSTAAMDRAAAVAHIKRAIEKTYKKRGEAVVRRNFEAVDSTLAHLFEVVVPASATASRRLPPIVPDAAPDFVKRVTALMLANEGDRLPVSAFPIDGTWPTGTAKWEKRNIATEIPVWDGGLCIQCNKCALVCPHAAIRVKVYPPSALEESPSTFKHVPFKSHDLPGEYTVQVAPEDCTGCALCVMMCPAKDKANPDHRAIDMVPQAPLLEAERRNYAFFLGLPEADRTAIKPDVKSTQFLEPLFEYSGACAGCGETPYIKLLTQLFGDRTIVANATGCSSIYGGNLPTTPYTTNRDGRGPAWANSLFEDNAEFGLGLRMAVDQHAARARALVREAAPRLPSGLADAILDAPQATEADVRAQRERIAELKRHVADPGVFDYLVNKSVWIVGGDGWAYDIGYGGLDHVLASGADVNVLVLDTEVYSNTGGQQSKSTPTGAAAKFAAAGKSAAKKDLGLMAMSYGSVYVAQVAFGAKDSQTLKAFLEAESYHGPSLIIAYSHCIAHGYDMTHGIEHQRLAAESGYWPMYRFDPRREAANLPALVLDSPAIKSDVSALMELESRFRSIAQTDRDHYDELIARARHNIAKRTALYRELATSGQR